MIAGQGADDCRPLQLLGGCTSQPPPIATATVAPPVSTPPPELVSVPIAAPATPVVRTAALPVSTPRRLPIADPAKSTTPEPRSATIERPLAAQPRQVERPVARPGPADRQTSPGAAANSTTVVIVQQPAPPPPAKIVVVNVQAPAPVVPTAPAPASQPTTAPQPTTVGAPVKATATPAPAVKAIVPSECKGLSEPVCRDATTCSWIGEAKNGARAHCRTKHTKRT